MASKQGLVADSMSITAMPIRNNKRKAPEHKWPNSKKAPAGDASPSFEAEDRSDTNVGDSHNLESEDEAELDESIMTPMTSQSASSPRYPSNAKTIPCTFDGCKKLFNRQAKLIQHLRSHTDTRPFVCHYTPCTKAYLRDTHLQHHIKSAHSQIRDYVCTWKGCDKSFSTGTRFRRHIAAHEGNTKTCTIDGCGQLFRKHSTMEAHIKRVHQGLKPYACQYLDDDGKLCGTGFDSPAQLRSHEGRLHARNTFECTICLPDEDGISPQSFPTYGTLQEHIRTDHPPTCDLCGLACASKSSLKSHIEVRHGGAAVEERKKFTCPEPGCGRGFTKKGNMNAHIQSAHHNQRYICGSISEADLNNVEGWDNSFACAEGFSTKANLEKHIRSVHFVSDDTLTRTRRGTPAATNRGDDLNANNDNDPIPCTIQGCNNHFPTIHDLASHLDSRHGLTDPKTQARTTTPAKNNQHPAIFARPGFQGSTTFASREDLDAETAFDSMFPSLSSSSSSSSSLFPANAHTDPSPESYDDAAPFWIGDDVINHEPARHAAAEDDNEWLFDEGEMRRLIGDGEEAGAEAGGGDEMDVDIDPDLG